MNLENFSPVDLAPRLNDEDYVFRFGIAGDIGKKKRV